MLFPVAISLLNNLPNVKAVKPYVSFIMHTKYIILSYILNVHFFKLNPLYNIVLFIYFLINYILRT